MNGKGSLAVFTIGMILIIAYFSIYGFSLQKTIRWGQYLGILFTSYCLLNEVISL
jgi:hypothetical protein